MRFIFFHGIYETLDRFNNALIKGAMGYGAECLDLPVSDPVELLFEKIQRFVDGKDDCAAILFNNAGLTLQRGSQNLWDAMKIPVYDILVDHPVNYDKYLVDPIEQLHVVVIDRKHEQFVRDVFPKVRQVYLLPHGGIESVGHRPYSDRDIDVLYVGKGPIDRPYLEINFLEDKGVGFYDSVFRELLSFCSVTTEEAVRHYVNTKGLALSYDEMLELYNKAVYSCEYNAVSFVKREVMQQLGGLGIPVTIYGGQWQDPTNVFPESIHAKGIISADECEQLMGNAKIVLNIQPWFKDGAHERVYNAMLNGAVCVTDTSGYMLETLEHGKNVVFYELDKIPLLVDNIRWLLDHPTEAEQIANNGYLTALLHDTWQSRFAQLMKMADL